MSKGTSKNTCLYFVTVGLELGRTFGSKNKDKRERRNITIPSSKFEKMSSRPTKMVKNEAIHINTAKIVITPKIVSKARDLCLE